MLVALAIAVALLTLPARLTTEATPALALAPMPPERTLYTDAPNGMFLLDRGWSTRPDTRNQGLRSGWQRAGATAGFTPVAVPNAFNAGDLSPRSFAGRVQWYRVTFTAPEVEGLAQWRLRFESVNVDARIWLNGVALGRHRGAYLPFELKASPTQLHSGENELVVRVDSRGSAGDLPPANRPLGWWNYGGILREVYLRAVRSFDLSDLRVTARPGNPAVAEIAATLTNMSSAPRPAAVTVRIDGPDGFSTTKTVDAGTLAAAARKPIASSVEIPNPQLWTPMRPSLYKLTVAVPGGQVTTAHFGVRAWSVGRDGRIRLNGHPLVLRGASFHEETPARGAALTPADRDTLVRELKGIGANFARQHYPPHPALLEAFDREGIVFWEQIPVWRVRGDHLRRARFRRTALGALRAAVLRDRNHASVLAWSASNETLRGGRPEITYFRAARSLLRRLDPTRLLAADKSLRPLDDIPRSYRLLDAIGLNEYVGWYGGRTSELRPNLATVHRKFPSQALVVTEFGAEANRSGSSRHKGSYAFQKHLLASHLAVFDRTPWLSGALVWLLRDVPIRPGWTGGNPHPRPPILFKGLFRRDGSAKPAAATVKHSFSRALAR